MNKTKQTAKLVSAVAARRVEISKAPPPIEPLGTGRPSLQLNRRFNEPDWDKWARHDIALLWECACLIANIEPPRFDGDEIWYTAQLRDFPDAFRTVWEAVNRDEWLSQFPVINISGRMLHSVRIDELTYWATTKGFTLSVPMQERAARIETAIKLRAQKTAVRPMEGSRDSSAVPATSPEWSSTVARVAWKEAMVKQWPAMLQAHSEQCPTAEKVLAWFQANDREGAFSKQENRQPGDDFQWVGADSQHRTATFKTFKNVVSKIKKSHSTYKNPA